MALITGEDTSRAGDRDYTNLLDFDDLVAIQKARKVPPLSSRSSWRNALRESPEDDMMNIEMLRRLEAKGVKFGLGSAPRISYEQLKQRLDNMFPGQPTEERPYRPAALPAAEPMPIAGPQLAPAEPMPPAGPRFDPREEAIASVAGRVQRESALLDRALSIPDYPKSIASPVPAAAPLDMNEVRRQVGLQDAAARSMVAGEGRRAIAGSTDLGRSTVDSFRYGRGFNPEGDPMSVRAPSFTRAPAPEKPSVFVKYDEMLGGKGSTTITDIAKSGRMSGANAIRAALGMGPVSFRRQYMQELDKLAGIAESANDRASAERIARLKANADVTVQRIKSKGEKAVARIAGKTGVRQSELGLEGQKFTALTAYKGKQLENETEFMRENVSRRQKVADQIEVMERRLLNTALTAADKLRISNEIERNKSLAKARAAEQLNLYQSDPSALDGVFTPEAHLIRLISRETDKKTKLELMRDLANLHRGTNLASNVASGE